jgi:hypothetical protein
MKMIAAVQKPMHLLWTLDDHLQMVGRVYVAVRTIPANGDSNSSGKCRSTRSEEGKLYECFSNESIK